MLTETGFFLGNSVLCKSGLAPRVCCLTCKVFGFCFVGHVFTLLCLVSSIFIPSITSLLVSLIFTLFSFLCFLLFLDFLHSPLLSSHDSVLQTPYASSSYLSSIHTVCFFFFFFFLTGDIFLLNTSRLPDRCEFSLHSPILPGSLDSCLLELAIYSQDAVPLLQRFTVEIRYVETNRNTVISLRVGHEENAG